MLGKTNSVLTNDCGDIINGTPIIAKSNVAIPKGTIVSKKNIDTNKLGFYNQTSYSYPQYVQYPFFIEKDKVVSAVMHNNVISDKIINKDEIVNTNSLQNYGNYNIGASYHNKYIFPLTNGKYIAYSNANNLYLCEFNYGTKRINSLNNIYYSSYSHINWNRVMFSQNIFTDGNIAFVQVYDRLYSDNSSYPIYQGILILDFSSSNTPVTTILQTDYIDRSNNGAIGDYFSRLKKISNNKYLYVFSGYNKTDTIYMRQSISAVIITKNGNQWSCSDKFVLASSPTNNTNIIDIFGIDFGDNNDFCIYYKCTALGNFISYHKIVNDEIITVNKININNNFYSSQIVKHSVKYLGDNIYLTFYCCSETSQIVNSYFNLFKVNNEGFLLPYANNEQNYNLKVLSSNKNLRNKNYHYNCSLTNSFSNNMYHQPTVLIKNNKIYFFTIVNKSVTVYFNEINDINGSYDYELNLICFEADIDNKTINYVKTIQPFNFHTPSYISFCFNDENIFISAPAIDEEYKQISRYFFSSIDNFLTENIKPMENADDEILGITCEDIEANSTGLVIVPNI